MHAASGSAVTTNEPVRQPGIYSCDPIQQPNTADAFSFSLLNTSDVQTLLNDIKTSSSAGQDGIPGRFLKSFAPELAPSLCTIFNSSLTQAVFPNQWKLSNVCPIWKNKGSKSDPSNYRPISIIPILGRVLEKAVASQLSVFCQTNNVIPPQQFGFRKHSSCESTLLCAIDNWANFPRPSMIIRLWELY